ncbi:AraC family transcriptional regulator [Paenibacillus antri]|nr:AraC family transcriptional regulator [Paenibacillus antri]
MRITRLVRHSFHLSRERFQLPEDRYADWALLAAQGGRFAYELASDEGTVARGFSQYGDVLLCPPGYVLRRDALEPVLFHFAEFAVDDPRDLPIGNVRVSDLQRLDSTFACLKDWQQDVPDRRDDSEGEHLLLDLLYLTVRARRQAERRENRCGDPLMEQAAAYIRQHALEGRLSLQQLAERLRIGPSQLTRRFQAAYGVSPVRYATEARLAKARALLADAELTLDEIAERCGFQNAFYFSRVFTKYMKSSPSAYRKTHWV